MCAVLNRAKEYDLIFHVASLHAWRILLFVSGFCSPLKLNFRIAEPWSMF